MNSYIFANIILFIIIASSLIFIIIKPFYFASLINILDKPNNNKLKIHNQPIPKNGGFIILFFIFLYQIINSFFHFDDFNLSIFTFIFLFFFIGLIDDYFDIKPLIRIILYAITVYLFLYFNNEYIVDYFYIKNINNYFSLKSLAIFFTIFCFIFMQNSLNMIDGINGSLNIYSILLTLIILLINPAIFNFIFLAALIITFIQNISNKIFLGNNGSSIISFIISLMLINAHYHNPLEFTSEIIFLLCFLPAIDMLRLFILRIWNKKNPFIGDLNHFHHLVFLKRKKTEWISLLIISYISLAFIALKISVNLALFIAIFIYLFCIWKFK